MTGSLDAYRCPQP